jgi:hypothetical protein
VAKNAIGEVAALGRVGIDLWKRNSLKLSRDVFRLLGVVTVGANTKKGFDFSTAALADGSFGENSASRAVYL